MDTQNSFIQEEAGSEPLLSESKLGKVSLIILLITIILSPLVFVSTSYAPLDSIKSIVITFGILISCILYSISILKGKTIYITKHPIILSGFLVVLSAVVSSLLSSNIQKSIFGQGFEIGTASFLVLMFLLSFFVIQITYKSKDRLIYVYSSFILTFVALGFFQVLRIFSPSSLTFGVFNTTTSTLIGKWYDLGVFSGIILLVTFIALRTLQLKSFTKILLYVLLIISAFFLIAINSTVIWSTISLVILFYVVSDYLKTTGSGTGLMKFFSKIPVITTIVFVVAVSLAIWGQTLASSLTKSLKFDQTEISLPWQLSLDVSSDTLKEKPLFGAGPNRFGSEFLLHKPQILNPSNFWNLEFSTGSGFIPSFIVTQGVFGIISWILFLVFFFALGIKTLKKRNDSYENFASLSTFLISSFLWMTFLIYNPSHVIMFFAFIMTGLFISTAGSDSIIPVKNYTRWTMIIASVSIIILALWTVVYVKKAVALGYFQGGIGMLKDSGQNKNLDNIGDKFKAALSWDKSDIYYQALSEITILKVNNLAQQIQSQDPKSIDQELVKKIGLLIDESVSYNQKAIELDPTNYYNYISLARISEIASTLQIPNAYENAKNSYINALKLNPLNPSIYLSLARLDASKNNVADAQKFIGAALQLKQNYIEAIFLLAQIQINQGQIKDAITSVQVATQINPNDPLLFFQLGFLYYNDKNYQGAIDVLSKAVSLNDQYANARYFLGLAYARLDNKPEAIKQFEKLAETNPDNKEVEFILGNLRAGKSPFSDVRPPVDSKPEKRKTLPIKEKSSESTIKTKLGN